MLAKVTPRRDDGESDFDDLVDYITDKDDDKEKPTDELNSSIRRRHHKILENARSHLGGAGDYLQAARRAGPVDADAIRVRLDSARKAADPDGRKYVGVDDRVENAVANIGDSSGNTHHRSLTRIGYHLRTAAGYLEHAAGADPDFQERARARRAYLAFNAQTAQRGHERDQRSALADLECGRLLGQPEQVISRKGISCEHNCLSLATASAEMKAVAAQNTRVKDPVYHVVLSWPAFESPTDAQAFECGRHALAAVGMRDHQYVFGVHHDTDNVHLHIAVNRVNPDSFIAVYPDRDYFKLDRAMRELELRFGWSHDNGPLAVFERNGRTVVDWSSTEPTTKGKRPAPAADMERHADQESLFSYVRGEPRKALLRLLRNEKFTWQQLHALLAKYGLELREKGQGFAIFALASPRVTPIKASDMHENLSKGRLIKRLGAFEPAAAQAVPVTTYDKHRPPKRDPQQREERRQERAEARRALRARYNEYKNGFVTHRLDPQAVRQRFADIRLNARRQRLDVQANVPDRLARKALYSVIAFETLRARERLQREIQKERAALRSDPANHRLRYREWVEHEAAAGEPAAISQLRGFAYSEKRQAKHSAQGAGTITKNGIQVQEDVDPAVSNLGDGFQHGVRRDGSIVYRTVAGADGFVDLGRRIEYLADESNEAILAAAIRLAAKKNGLLQLTGTDEFKLRAVSAIANNKIDVQLEDQALEARRQAAAAENAGPSRSRSRNMKRPT